MQVRIVTLTIIATCGWHLASGVAVGETLPPYPTVFSDAVQARTFVSAWERAAGVQDETARLFVRPDRREELLAFAQPPGARAAESAAVQAALGAEPSTTWLAERKALERLGLANEHAALMDSEAARTWEAPQADEQGVYYSYAQTLTYGHHAGTDTTAMYMPEYYQHLRCRAAVRVGPLSSSRAWRYWRVCPDAQGRYRPAL